jgi:NADH:ubiquinone oxidoreductase subunit K
MLQTTLAVSAYLLCIGFYGLINSRNMIRALMCVELMLNGVNLNFLAFASSFINKNGIIQGQIFVLFIIAIAAVEAAIGLAIVLKLYRNRNSIAIDQFNILKW